jgi:hypothetical protein
LDQGPAGIRRRSGEDRARSRLRHRRRRSAPREAQLACEVSPQRASNGQKHVDPEVVGASAGSTLISCSRSPRRRPRTAVSAKVVGERRRADLTAVKDAAAAECRNELTVFPQGKHDDQVDSTAKRSTGSSAAAGPAPTPGSGICVRNSRRAGAHTDAKVRAVIDIIAHSTAVVTMGPERYRRSRNIELFEIRGAMSARHLSRDSGVQRKCARCARTGPPAGTHISSRLMESVLPHRSNDPRRKHVDGGFPEMVRPLGEVETKTRKSGFREPNQHAIRQLERNQRFAEQADSLARDRRVDRVQLLANRLGRPPPCGPTLRHRSPGAIVS